DLVQFGHEAERLDEAEADGRIAGLAVGYHPVRGGSRKQGCRRHIAERHRARGSGADVAHGVSIPGLDGPSLLFHDSAPAAAMRLSEARTHCKASRASGDAPSSPLPQLASAL